MRLSIIIEWANTKLNGISRAWQLLDILGEQWQEILEHKYPENISEQEKLFLNNLDPCPEILLVSGEQLTSENREKIRETIADYFDLQIHISEGLEYYPLKNFGANLAKGDLLMFLDSDVLPEKYWLAHLLSSFANPEIKVCCSQTYIEPIDLINKAFSLWWFFDLREDKEYLSPVTKLHTNNLVFQTKIFHQTQFSIIGSQTRGAGSLMKKQLDLLGINVWKNYRAKVRHPAPSHFKHLIIRALAEGRDTYMKYSKNRSIESLIKSIKRTLESLFNGVDRTFKPGRFHSRY